LEWVLGRLSQAVPQHLHNPSAGACGENSMKQISVIVSGIRSVAKKKVEIDRNWTGKLDHFMYITFKLINKITISFLHCVVASKHDINIISILEKPRIV
jgi:hypothetical protein